MDFSWVRSFGFKVFSFGAHPFFILILNGLVMAAGDNLSEALRAKFGRTKTPEAEEPAELPLEIEVTPEAEEPAELPLEIEVTPEAEEEIKEEANVPEPSSEE